MGTTTTLNPLEIVPVGHLGQTLVVWVVCIGFWLFGSISQWFRPGWVISFNHLNGISCSSLHLFSRNLARNSNGYVDLSRRQIQIISALCFVWRGLLLVYSSLITLLWGVAVATVIFGVEWNTVKTFGEYLSEIEMVIEGRKFLGISARDWFEYAIVAIPFVVAFLFWVKLVLAYQIEQVISVLLNMRLKEGLTII